MKSEKSAALLLMGAAMIGILFANSPFATNLIYLKSFAIDFGLFSIDVEHFVSEFLLAIFFLVAGLELKHEMRLGALSNPLVALVPVIAAIAGVLIPAGIYLLINPEAPFSMGWPIPTATDIAFALGMLAIIGKGLPPAARVFLLALAIFDDVIAILIIAVQFTENLRVGWLFVALSASLALRLMYLKISPNLRLILISACFGISWFAIYSSGVHATIAGVLTGLAIPASATHKLVARIQPFSNWIVLPIFAFFAVSIQLPENFSASNSIFLGIAIALPLGKLVGIAFVGFVLNQLVAKEARLKLSFIDFSVVACLAGIGFTVSLLLAKLCFEAEFVLRSEAIFGVLVASTISMILASVLARIREITTRGKSSLPS